MTRAQHRLRITAGVILFFVAFCILGTMAGIWINGRYYALERAREGPADRLPDRR